MKRYFISENTIDQELLEKFGSLLSDKEHEKIKVYFRCQGGSISSGLCLIDMLNENSERVEIVCNYEISSMAVCVVLLCKCKVTIVPECTFLIHKMRSTTKRLLTDGKHIDDFDFVSDTKCEFQSEYDTLMKSLLTPKQIKLYDSGKDIIIDSVTMRNMLCRKK